jgi:hypothetical protein
MPNPVRSIFNIGLNSYSTTIADIAIYNSAGKKIMLRKDPVKTGYNVLAFIETNDWHAGIYYVVIGINNNLIRKKIVLVK